MQGVLEGTEPDTSDYGICYDKYIASIKNGKTYLHFYEGLISNSVAIKNFPSSPKAVKFMNSGKMLKYNVIPLPEFMDMTKDCQEPLLHIYGIDADKYSDEPIVIEIEW